VRDSKVEDHFVLGAVILEDARMSFQREMPYRNPRKISMRMTPSVS